MLDRATRFTAFATLGVVSTSQELVRLAFGGIAGADPELVAEETLCLTATTTACAAEVGLRETPDVAQAILSALLDLPFIYHDYLVGGAMIVQQDPTIQQTSRDIYQRLERKRTFYTAHFPPGQFPGERALTDKMELWMGRISPPQLPESPQDRLAKLDCVPLLLTHLKLVLAFARQEKDGG